MATVLVAGLVAFCCSVTIPAWNSPEALNWQLVDCFPRSLAPLFALMPVILYCAYYTANQVRYNDKVKEHYRQLEEQVERRIIFRSRAKFDEEGSTWEIRNCNGFVWTGAKLLIERRSKEGDKVCEKHKLGVLASGERVQIESQLAKLELAQWRAMVITQQGELIDFPDPWQPNTYYDQALESQEENEEDLEDL